MEGGGAGRRRHARAREAARGDYCRSARGGGRARSRAQPEEGARHTKGAEAREGVAQDPIRRLIP